MRSRNPLLRQGARVVLAHQGASRVAPPNTLPAFRAAVAAGADAFELDVHWTRDSEIVVSHDDTVDQLSNGTGRIRDMTLAELRRLDFGWGFSPDRGRTFPWRDQGVQIPTLREVLQEFPEVPATIEVKPADAPSLARLLREIHEAGAIDRVIAASFHHGVLCRLRSMNRRLRTSASVQEAACFWGKVRAGLPVRRVPFDVLQVPPRAKGLKVLTPRVLSRARALGVPVHVWTIDNPAAIEHWWRFGVDGIVSNEPGVARLIRDQLFSAPDAKEA
jgi:glycerophosphoryl diester phosphodiesterase